MTAIGYVSKQEDGGNTHRLLHFELSTSRNHPQCEQVGRRLTRLLHDESCDRDQCHQITMAETSDNEYVGLTFAAAEFGPRKLYTNLGGNGMIDANFLTLIWTPID